MNLNLHADNNQYNIFIKTKKQNNIEHNININEKKPSNEPYNIFIQIEKQTITKTISSSKIKINQYPIQYLNIKFK